MNRNWSASENPPRHWRPTRRHLRDVAIRRAIPVPPGPYPVRDVMTSWRHLVAFAEYVENLYNVTMERGV